MVAELVGFEVELSARKLPTAAAISCVSAPRGSTAGGVMAGATYEATVVVVVDVMVSRG
jgi:hypothetical protein